MKILAIETSTQACSVAISIDHKIEERYELAPREHNKLLLPMVKVLLDETGVKISDLDALSFSAGPGSFTGIRIAASVTQALAAPSDLSVIPISSLQVLAQTAYRLFNFKKSIPCFDARMNEVYWAHCEFNDELNLMEFAHKPVCTKPESLIIPNKSYAAIGEGHAAYEYLKQKQKDFIAVEIDCFPHAKDLAFLANHCGVRLPAAKALPLYLREMQYKKISSG